MEAANQEIIENISQPADGKQQQQAA